MLDFPDAELPIDARSVSDQAVADTGFSSKVAWPGGVCFKLSAELRHVDTEVLRLLAMLRTPDFD